MALLSLLHRLTYATKANHHHAAHSHTLLTVNIMTHHPQMHQLQQTQDYLQPLTPSCVVTLCSSQLHTAAVNKPSQKKDFHNFDWL